MTAETKKTNKPKRLSGNVSEGNNATLSSGQFLDVITFAPLVSIDMIIRNTERQVLLGLRTNRPALGYWFVPGGRIRKDESINHALSRIALAEIGESIGLSEASLIGVFEHRYEDNLFAVPEISTHYVVLAYQVSLQRSTALKGDNQHSELKWWGIDELCVSPQVHPYTKAYFYDGGQDGCVIPI